MKFGGATDLVQVLLTAFSSGSDIWRLVFRPFLENC
jgi:hypothetical protein